FKGFNITVERAIITDLKNSTYFARLILQQNNELGRKILEIDARPSDCLALVTAQKRPLFVSSTLFSQVEDMSKWLEEINENGGDSEPEYPPAFVLAHAPGLRRCQIRRHPHYRCHLGRSLAGVDPRRRRFRSQTTRPPALSGMVRPGRWDGPRDYRCPGCQ